MRSFLYSSIDGMEMLQNNLSSNTKAADARPIRDFLLDAIERSISFTLCQERTVLHLGSWRWLFMSNEEGNENAVKAEYSTRVDASGHETGHEPLPTLNPRRKACFSSCTIRHQQDRLSISTNSQRNVDKWYLRSSGEPHRQHNSFLI